MANYPLANTASQINLALQAVVGADAEPTNGSDDMVTSNGVFDYIETQLGPFKTKTVTTQAAGISNTDNETSIPTSAAVKDFVDTTVAATTAVASFTKASGNITATGLITGYTEVDTSTIAAESSGTITVTGAGTYLINFNGLFSESGTGSFDVKYRVDGSAVMTRDFGFTNQEIISYSVPKVISSGTFTVDIQGVESGSGDLNFTDVRVDIIKIA